MKTMIACCTAMLLGVGFASWTLTAPSAKGKTAEATVCCDCDCTGEAGNCACCENDECDTCKICGSNDCCAADNAQAKVKSTDSKAVACCDCDCTGSDGPCECCLNGECGTCADCKTMDCCHSNTAAKT